MSRSEPEVPPGLDPKADCLPGVRRDLVWPGSEGTKATGPIPCDFLDQIAQLSAENAARAKGEAVSHCPRDWTRTIEPAFGPGPSRDRKSVV